LTGRQAAERAFPIGRVRRSARPDGTLLGTMARGPQSAEEFCGYSLQSGLGSRTRSISTESRGRYPSAIEDPVRLPSTTESRPHVRAEYRPSRKRREIDSPRPSRVHPIAGRCRVAYSLLGGHREGNPADIREPDRDSPYGVLYARNVSDSDAHASKKAARSARA